MINNYFKKTKVIIIAIFFFFNFFAFCIPVYSDAGPKPSISINAKNMPDEKCYMDLLIYRPTDNLPKSSKFLDIKYNQNMVDILRKYSKDGWRSVVVNRLYPLTIGDIACETENGRCSTSFSYHVPDQFKIIVVSESGQIKVSNAINRKSYNSEIFFDYKTCEAIEGPIIMSSLSQYLATCFWTIIIEAMILFLFRFSIKQNWKLLLYINLATQTFLSLIILLTCFLFGSLAAFLSLIFVEILIFITESILFTYHLKQHTKVRRILFSIVANFVSLIMGIIIMNFNSVIAILL